MDGTAPDRQRDRPFDPSKTATADASRALVADVLHQIEAAENRQRARREVDHRHFKAMVNAIVLDLAYCALLSPRGALAIPLQKTQYSAKTRSAPFLMETFPDLVHQMARIELIDIELGHRSPFGDGRRTTVRASDRLRQLVEDHGVSLSDIGRDIRRRRDVLVLKGCKVLGKAPKLPVPDTEETRRLRHEMNEINAWLATAEIEWMDEKPVDVGDRFLSRIFNNARLDHGGRLNGGFWQQRRAEDRLNYLWIDGSPIVSLDYGQIGVRTAYSLVGADPPAGDLYAIPGLTQHREGVKKVLSAMLASDKMPRRFPQKTRALFPGSYKFDDVLGPILAHHPNLTSRFGTSLAHHLMHIESNLMVGILLRLKAMEIIALPVHDCLLVSQKVKEQAKEVMEDSFMQMLGRKGVVEESLPTVTFSLGRPSASPLGGA